MRYKEKENQQEARVGLHKLGGLTLVAQPGGRSRGLLDCETSFGEEKDFYWDSRKERGDNA